MVEQMITILEGKDQMSYSSDQVGEGNTRDQAVKEAASQAT